jgi:D-glycero-D-manno-heptose 1,7-bisphosphate phosphatase
MRALQDAGFALAIATNQPGPAKGQMSAAAVERTNRALVEKLATHGVRISDLEVCMHHPQGGSGGDPTLARSCDCRKPKPGLLLALLRRLDGDASLSWMIGDGAADLEAGRANGSCLRANPLRAVPAARGPPSASAGRTRGYLARGRARDRA